MQDGDKKNNNNWGILKLLFIIIFSISILFVTNIESKDVVYADSGFDTSYDSGGSDWGSSSYDYDYDDYHYSSSSGRSSSSSGFDIFDIMVVIVVIVIIIISYLAKSKRLTTGNIPQMKPTNVNDDAINEKIKGYIPNFNKSEFLSEGYNIYLDIQNAWMNFKLDDVRDKITDEMFNMYQSQLDTLEVKGEQNIMKDFTKVNAYLKDVVKQNENITITACYVIEFYDYIVEQSTGKVLRGSASSKMRVTYDMKFRKTLDDKLTTNRCPNCGAEIKNMNGSGICEYCGSKLVSENSKWVLTDKKTINQIKL